MDIAPLRQGQRQGQWQCATIYSHSAVTARLIDARWGGQLICEPSISRALPSHAPRRLLRSSTGRRPRLADRPVGGPAALGNGAPCVVAPLAPNRLQRCIIVHQRPPRPLLPCLPAHPWPRRRGGWGCPRQRACRWAHLAHFTSRRGEPQTVALPQGSPAAASRAPLGSWRPAVTGWFAAPRSPPAS